MLADQFDLAVPTSGRKPRQAADDLANAPVARYSLREKQIAVVRAVGNRAGRQSRIDLIDLLLVIRLQRARCQLREIAARQRKFVLDTREVGLRGIPGLIRTEFDSGRRRLATTDQRDARRDGA